MGAINDLARVKELTGTRAEFRRSGFKRSGQQGYVEYVEQQAAVEQQKIDSIVSESNRTMREIEEKKRMIAVREERARLQCEETPEVYQVIPRVSISDIEVTDETAKEIGAAFKRFRERVEIEPADYRLLTGFCEQNDIDVRSPEIIERALQFIIDRLTLIESGGPIPEKPVPVEVKPEDVNPFPKDLHPRSAWSGWERQKTNREAFAEQVVPVRQYLEEVVKHGSKDLEISSIDHLMTVMRSKQRAFTRENTRKTFLEVYGMEMSESERQSAFDAGELASWKNDLEDSKLSSDGLKAKYRQRW